MAQFWDAVDRMFALARTATEKQRETQIQLSLQARQAALSTTFARLLVQNNENEGQAAQRIGEVYGRVQRQLYFFLVATLGGNSADESLPDPIESPDFRGTFEPLRSTQRTGAGTDRIPGIDVASYFAGAA